MSARKGLLLRVDLEGSSRAARRSRAKSLIALAGALFALALAAGAEPAPGPSDPREAEAFFDGAVPALLEAYHVPGLVLSVVRDGRVLLAKGWGLADVETGRAMDAERTLVRVASVSKLVTATAALQLVAQGKLDLHADVNRYLEGFQIEEAFGAPVTLHHLLTHTAGFDDRFLHSGRAYGSVLPPLGDYLVQRMPPRVMPPGRVVSYSNHGLALVGHLVERASGLSFTDYVQQHVFDPLRMTRSRFFLRVPLDPDVAVPYRWAEGRQLPLGYDHTLLGPAAELNTTAIDMAKFMLAHLGQGEARLLDPATEGLMQERHFAVHPQVAGWAYGFEESFLNGRRAVGHGGDWRGFESLLLLFPEQGWGVFASANGMFDALAFYTAFSRALADHYLPAPPPARLEPPADFAARAGRYTGTYVMNRRIRGDFMKLGQLIMHARVEANEEGGLTLTTPGAGLAVRLVAVEPDLFRYADEERHAHFFVEPDTGTEHLVLGGFLTLDRVAWWQSPRLHVAAGGAAALLLAGSLLGWGLGAAARLLRGAAPSPTPLAARVIGSLVALLFLSGLAAIAGELRPERFPDLLIAIPGTLRAGFAAIATGSLGALALPVFAWRGLRPGTHAPLARLHLALLAAAALLLAVQAAWWNLLGAAFE
jgi:CubicO group peptidase (beta-lactamase class C family)